MYWCDTNNFHGQKPDVQHIARFLAHLHLYKKLAYSTILVHTYIITSCKIRQYEIDGRLLLRQIIKAFSTAQPVIFDPLVWYVEIVYNWLANSAVNILCLKYLSRRQ